MAEPKYPIYSISVSWVEDIPNGYEPGDYAIRGLPPGRMRNCTGWRQMHRTFQSLPEIEAKMLVEWWPDYSRNRKDRNPVDPVFSVEFKKLDTWCSGWFSHWTFDNGQSDMEAVDSFERYVDRIEKENVKARCETGDEFAGEPLMGAEDRWRWHGTETGEKGDDSRTDPPCRCPACKRRGLIWIGH